MTTNVRTDADTLGLIQYAYQLVENQIDRTEFERYRYADPQGFVPLNPQTAPGVDSTLRYRLTTVGQWRMAADYATNTDPVDFYLTPIVYGAEYFKAHTRWSNRELDRMEFARRNNMAGISIDIAKEKQLAIEETYMQLLNKVNSVGIPQKNIYGLHSHPDVPVLIAPYKLGLARTPDENLAVLSLFSTTIRRNTKQIEAPNTALFPDRVIRELSIQKVSTSGDKSTLAYWLENEPYIKDVDTAPELDTAGPGGVELAQAYDRSPNKLDYMVPKPMQMDGPLQFHAGHWRQDYDSELSGVHFRRPYSSVKMVFPAS